ncbi:tRNA (guanosine(37)-N1)-methyltransferase TrmD [Desulfofundulus thermosubterraneus]|uniref:tRNA (guanine-N(1)-)-methyltransferase n=1 Tax=Desulfofundulus thermosubterraneus DSM 16057 TaxID=1121432 RepID=A0A1M6KUN3_9FIRM|nr:tRNA (guanosine(37)-N1)-methyltransferase TrmD [Desulfofundulus thermosubterraneus]SHJ62685.1 tRNA (guanine37-N1)-methyltransferase [Desulfofundulus thermosubterraneus DSM 16057]
MVVDILTLFPEMFAGPFDASIIKRAREKGLVKINLINIRDFSRNKHRTVDDTPYGGGAGMVMAAEPLFEAMDWIRTRQGDPGRVILLCPAGRPFNQEVAAELAREEHLVLICGHYEGIDERVAEHLVTDEISIGDYVLTGGELPAMVVVDAVCRLIPGVLGERASAQEESFSDGLLEYPHYTRPREYRGYRVPEVLLSGHHEKIRLWRRRQSLLRTLASRPDLLARASLTEEDRKILASVLEEIKSLIHLIQ